MCAIILRHVMSLYGDTREQTNVATRTLQHAESRKKNSFWSGEIRKQQQQVKTLLQPPAVGFLFRMHTSITGAAFPADKFKTKRILNIYLSGLMVSELTGSDLQMEKKLAFSKINDTDCVYINETQQNTYNVVEENDLDFNRQNISTQNVTRIDKKIICCDNEDILHFQNGRLGTQRRA
ncbi:hypothetical protein CBL_10413 [Carabus blaptoides fortunei]